MKELSVNHLLGIKYINNSDIDLIFETADHFKEVINRPIKKVLRYETLPLLIYFENSTDKTFLQLAQKIVCRCYQFSAAQSSVKGRNTNYR
jgi:aspartate carbamoyltransferase catalytic subunit